ncbi:SDR family NAD(P)-dependent oxidoreductase [Anaerostipes sp.]|uniref:SDR family NAD(P)-dependent oxidoreductase n=1 Tax=Anaerostipes sp. TaxID=1872530 RepID=UPI0025C2C1F4|nr:SDR family oxidoreductase [Anaerostipes sp.]MBS7007377.1 SDR family oxidoreductase [Anaerostipes sp.]
MEYVLITGGSGGIGFELARIFAQNKFGVILVSSDREKLWKAKEKLKEEFDSEIEVYEKDLSKTGAAGEMYREVLKKERNITVLVNNAGFGLKGETQSIDMKEDQKMLALNVGAVVELTKLFLKDRYKEKSGKVLNISSSGAFQPGPYTSTYFASKAFVLSYSRAVRYEARKYGIQVCTLCPGAVRTDFFQREGAKIPAGAMEPESVAKYAYRRLMKNKSVSVPGWRNRLLRLPPGSIKMKFIAAMKQ